MDETTERSTTRCPDAHEVTFLGGLAGREHKGNHKLHSGVRLRWLLALEKLLRDRLSVSGFVSKCQAMKSLGPRQFLDD